MTVDGLLPSKHWFKQRARAGCFWFLLLLALIQPLQYLHLTFLEFSAGDEGVLLAGALRILHGQVPYRDFFSFRRPVRSISSQVGCACSGQRLLRRGGWPFWSTP